MGRKHLKQNSTVKTVFSLVNSDADGSHTVGLTWANTKCHVVIVTMILSFDLDLLEKPKQPVIVASFVLLVGV